MADISQPPEAGDGLPLAAAAARLGIAERTLREWIKQGKVTAKKVVGPNGYAAYRVFLDTPPPVAAESPPLADIVYPPPAADLLPLADMTPLATTIEKLTQQILELSGRCGFLQAQLQAAERRILELEAPKEAVRGAANHPTPSENGAEAGSERYPRRPWWRFWS